MCGVCSRGYRDKRELKKHQITHNHLDANPDSPAPVPATVSVAAAASNVVAPVVSNNTVPAPATQLTLVAPAAVPGRQPVPAPTMPAVSAVAVSPAKAATVMAVAPAIPPPPPPQSQPPPPPVQNSSMATITFSLPTEPVPKNQLGLAPDPPPQPVYAPLNPAQIQLPPSVAAALQSMNNKVTSKQQQQHQATVAPAAAAPAVVLAAAPTTPVKQEALTTAQIPGGHVIKQIQGTAVEAGDGSQITLASSFPGIISSGGPQVFYYVMPPNTVQPLITEGATTVRATGPEGGATQFLALPAGTIQATVPVSSVNGAFPQWIIGRKLFTFY